MFPAQKKPKVQAAQPGSAGREALPARPSHHGRLQPRRPGERRLVRGGWGGMQGVGPGGAGGVRATRLSLGPKVWPRGMRSAGDKCMGGSPLSPQFGEGLVPSPAPQIREGGVSGARRGGGGRVPNLSGCHPGVFRCLLHAPSSALPPCSPHSPHSQGDCPDFFSLAEGGEALPRVRPTLLPCTGHL